MDFKAIKNFFTERDKLAALLGIELVEVSDGKAVTRMEIKPEHLNGANTLHGGAIFSLADVAFAAAANSKGFVAVAIAASVSFTKAATRGALTAEAVVMADHPKLSTVWVTVKDDDGNVIATFQGTAYRKKIDSIEGLN